MHVNAFLDVDVIALEQHDTVTVLLEMTAPPAPHLLIERPAHTIVVVLDRSGSMHGDRLDAAKSALLNLIDRLDPKDRLGVVTFDDSAQVAIPATVLGDYGKDNARAVVQHIYTGGNTDLSSGYLRGIQEARRVAGKTGATIVLLSDGQANAGVTDPKQLLGLARDAHAKGVTTSTIGIGRGYDETVLTAITSGGAGNHSFADIAEQAATALAAEVTGLLNKTVQAASLHIKPGNEISTITVLNELPCTGVSDGILVELGDFYGDETRRIVLTVEVPGRRELGLVSIADLEFRYVELPALVEHTVKLPLAVNVRPGDEAAHRIRKPEVEREKLLLEVQREKLRGEESLRRGDIGGARSAMVAASLLLDSAPMALRNEDLIAESDWFAASLGTLDTEDESYNRKRMSSSRMKHERGTRDREQGGEIA
jgi:Ca-activated chloride channel family protein